MVTGQACFDNSLTESKGSHVEGVGGMRNLNDNEWILINEIIYKMNTIRDIEQVQKTFLELIKILISYDSALFYLKDTTGKKLFSDPVCVHYSKETAGAYIEYGLDKDYTMGIMQCSKCMVYRETDLLPESERENSEYYRLFLSSQDMHFGVQATFVYHDDLLGIVSLLRKKSNPDFSEKDVFVLEMLKEHMAFRLFCEFTEATAGLGDRKFDYRWYEEKYHLTKRELDVLKQMFEYRTDDEICAILCISNSTLKKHILHIYSKLDVKNRLQLTWRMEKERQRIPY